MVDDKKSQADTQEPSMEDILASIRRILSEEDEDKADAGRGAAPADDVDPNHATPERDMPQLRPEETAASDGAQKQLAADPEAAARDGDADVAFDSPESPVGAIDSHFDLDGRSELQRDDVLDLTPEMRANSMISPESALASTDVLAQLAKAILSRRDVAVGGSDVTIESMVREMLRPMLKEWLDRNLPYLVERLVKREIDLMVNRAERLED
ncbi:MAG: DUF2497 domain-containing protein [Rhodospirillales bacterium]|nr:DUF2497 domain-containing protein [Rhodospirillales bacterium]